MAEPLILTNVGLAKLASATPEDQLHIADVAVGDGNGGYPPLDPSMTALVHEVWRGTASSPIRDPDNDAVLIFETIIPANEGGFFIREIGLFDADGDMIAIGQTGIVEKPNGGSGTPMTMTVRVRLALANASQTNLIINDAPYIDHQALSNRSANNAHPMSAITGLSSALNGKLAKSQNLADLADVATARYNLELGTAALRDATTSNTDATLGRVVRVGDFGIGRKIPLEWPTGDMDAAPTNVPNGFYVCEYSTANKPTDYGGMIIWQWHGPNTGTLTYTTYDIRPRVFVRRWYGTEWAGWREVTRTQISGTDTNIDNYVEPGVYVLPVVGITGLPPGWGNVGNYLFVEGDPTDPLRMQTLQSCVTGHIAVRYYNTGTSAWTTWQSKTYDIATTLQAQFLADDKTVITPLKLRQSGAVFTGEIRAFAGPLAQIPAGYLPCNGALVSRATYSDLFNVIGDIYGAGDGATTFRIPDLRGEFLRGLDNGRGVDAGRSLGEHQDDALQNVTGNINTIVFSGTTGTATGPFSLFGTTNGIYGGGSSGNARGVSFNLSLAARTADETRPRNMPVNFIIKY